MKQIIIKYNSWLACKEWHEKWIYAGAIKSIELKKNNL